MKVPYVNWVLQYKNLKKEIDKAVLGCFKRGDFIMRDEVKEFEDNLCKFIGTKYAIGLNSGTDALFLSLKAVGIGEGDEVITVSWTFIATFAAIVQTGAKPVLVDVNDKYVMNMDLVEEAITPRTKAIIPVHLNGEVCDMDKLMAIAKDLIVIEDAAQAFSQSYKGKMAGSFGLTGCFSFYPSKLVGAYGDAGGVVTDDENIYKKIRLLQDHGRVTKSETVCFGYNSRLDNIQAAILNVKLKHLTEAKERRREIAEMYRKGLSDIPEIKIPLPDTCEYPVMRVQKRDELFNYLKKQGVETQIHEPYPYHWIKGLGLSQYKLPVTEQLVKEVISLPLNPELSNEEVSYIIKEIREFYEDLKITLSRRSSI